MGSLAPLEWATVRAPVILIMLAWAIWPVSLAWGQEEAWPVAGRTPSHLAVAEGPAPPYRVAWERDLDGGPPVAPPVLGDGRLVVVGRSSVAALDPETGDTLWSVDRATGTGGAPALAGDLVLFVEGQGEEAALVAVTAAEGELVWRTGLDAHAPGGVTVEGGRAFVASRAGTLHAVDVEDGSVEWTLPEDRSGRRFESAPAVAGGLVLVTGQNRQDRTSFLHAIDEESGERSWGYRPEGVGVGVSSASEGGGLVVAGTVDGRPRASAFDLAGGSDRWATDLRLPFTGRQMPVVTQEAVVIADAAGHLYRLDPGSGELLWTFRVPGFLLGGSPSISGDTVLVGDVGGQLSAIDLQSGLLVWKRSFGEDQVHPVAVGADRIYVAARGGAVAALEHDPGGELLEEPSPTTLYVGEALLNFAAAFAAVGGAMILVGMLWRRRA